MKSKLLVLLPLLLMLICAAASAERKVAIQMYQNVGAYSKPCPYSRFVGWAKMEGHYTVLDSVRGNKGRTWLKILLDDGVTEGYIPEIMTTDVVENIEGLVKYYVQVHPEGSIHMHRKPIRYHDDEGYKPYCDSPLMGWAWKGNIYPVIDGPKNGWVKIVFENGTAGWVSGDYARPYDPVEDVKPKKIRVTHETSILVRKKPDKDSEVITGIRPGEEFPCVYVNDNGWHEIAFPTGAYGYVSAKLVELIEGE